VKWKQALWERNPPRIAGWVYGEWLPEVVGFFLQPNLSEHSPIPKNSLPKNSYENDVELSNQTIRLLHFTLNQDTILILTKKHLTHQR